MMKKILTIVIAIFATACSVNLPAAELRAVPPNMIGLMLTPTGFDGKIYEPGQVDIGNESWSGYGNKLMLIQKSGFQIKEQFVTLSDNDGEDHRCIVGPKREPMTLDVRLLFALPDYNKREGTEAILRMGLLGNPKDLGARVLLLDAASVYIQQVQQEVRGKIRDVCISYESVEAVFKAVEQNGTSAGFSDVVRKAVGTVLDERNSPLFLVGAVVSNVKPDKTVIDAIAAEQAAAHLVKAMQKIDDFIKADSTGTRSYIYKMMAVQGVVSKAGGSGQNTVFMTDVSGGGLIPIPMK